MKQRINISIEYGLIKEIRELKYINNLSRYLEKCLKKSLEYYKKINNTITKSKQENQVVTDEDIRKLIEEMGDD